MSLSVGNVFLVCDSVQISLLLLLLMIPSTYRCADHISGKFQFYYNNNIEKGIDNSAATNVNLLHSITINYPPMLYMMAIVGFDIIQHLTIVLTNNNFLLRHWISQI